MEVLRTHTYNNEVVFGAWGGMETSTEQELLQHDMAGLECRLYNSMSEEEYSVSSDPAIAASVCESYDSLSVKNLATSSFDSNNSPEETIEGSQLSKDGNISRCNHSNRGEMVHTDNTENQEHTADEPDRTKSLSSLRRMISKRSSKKSDVRDEAMVVTKEFEMHVPSKVSRSLSSSKMFHKTMRILSLPEKFWGVKLLRLYNGKDEVSLASTASESGSSITDYTSDGSVYEPDLIDLVRIMERRLESGRFKCQDNVEVETVLPDSLDPDMDEAVRDVNGELPDEVDICKSMSMDVTDIPLIQDRLLETNVLLTADDIGFVPGQIFKSSEPTPYGYVHVETAERNVTYVKTYIWEVKGFDEYGASLEPFYVATGISSESDVDMRKLRRAIFNEQPYDIRPQLRLLSPREVEGMAGKNVYEPETDGMRLLLDDSILEDIPESSYKTHRVSIGTRVNGRCLSISAEKFLAMAEANPRRVEIHSLVKRTQKVKLASLQSCFESE